MDHLIVYVAEKFSHKVAYGKNWGNKNRQKEIVKFGRKNKKENISACFVFSENTLKKKRKRKDYNSANRHIVDGRTRDAHNIM